MDKISVIIVTRNRDKALKEMALSSLISQTYKNFEIIVWDASDNDESKEVVWEFKKSNSPIDIKWFLASRKGICSQRNDAIRASRGNIILFMDDDGELSPDALASIIQEFKNKDIYGVGLPLKIKNTSSKNTLKTLIALIYSHIFKLSQARGKFMKVYLSGWNIGWHDILKNLHMRNKAQWLEGTAMAFRRELFDKFFFEEKLEKFGGYAFGEDLQFSHKIYRNGLKLTISSFGYVIHHKIEGGRISGFKETASMIYNHFLIWKTTIWPYNRFSVFVYIWSLIGESMYQILTGSIFGKKERLTGLRIGVKEILKEIKQQTKVGSYKW